MSISKKMRFEVFKRDGFQCGYCGKTPPQVTLEVDHIDPKSQGGGDDINNLITACFDCNRGKSNIPLEKAPLRISENLEILKEQEAQLKEYRKFSQKIESRIKKDLEDINAIYIKAYPGWELSEHFKNGSVRQFLKHLPKHEVEEAMHIAIGKFPTDDDRVTKYFCGVCWRKIKGDYEDHYS